MKAGRWISLILAGVTAVSLLAGCGAGTEDSQDSSAQTAQEDTDTQAAEEETDEGTGTSGNVLVVYYSATGNTEEVANYIADATGVHKIISLKS